MPALLRCSLSAAAALLAAVGVGFAVSAQSEPVRPREPVAPQAVLMERKLAAAQSLLRSLTTEDFPALAASTGELLEIARQQWRAQETPE